MRVFEFYFNPKLKPELTCGSFCFEPENVYEKKLGSLYLAGLLKNTLPQNQRFLNNLAEIIKEKYYSQTSSSPEKALRESLKSANNFLEAIAKKGDVSWLGNFNFAAISFKDSKINFTKVGEIKIILLRKGQIIDIDKKLKFQDIEPYPLKIFPNIISGKLTEGDLIFLATKEIHQSFQDQNLITAISQIKPFEPASLNEVLKEKNETLAKLSGVLLLMHLDQEKSSDTKEYITLQPLNKFSLSKIFLETFLPIIVLFKKRGKKLLKLKKLSQKNKGKTELPKWKKFLPAIFLIFLLFVGFIVSQKENKRMEAERKEKEKILKQLYQQNKLADITEPELFFEISNRDFIPQRMASDNKNIYLFNPFSKTVFAVSPEKKGETISLDENFELIGELNDSVFLFSPPNRLATIKDGVLSKTDLLSPAKNFKADRVSSFSSNLYFLDETSGEIIKFPYSKDLTWDSPFVWKRNSPDVTSGEFLAVDGSVWVLNKDNSISRFYAGAFQETVNLNIFPEKKDFSKLSIKPGLPYLYLLEPAQNRIIISDKQGKIIKQFRSNKFNGLLDFTVSKDGKIIYLLNNQKIYRILF